jgi:hypothetical protein
MTSERSQSSVRWTPLIAVLALGCMFPPQRVEAQASPCLGPNATSAAFLAKLDSIFTMSDTGNVSWRNLLNVQQTTSAQIKLVTKKATCQAAVTAVNTLVQHVTPGRTVYVFEAGPHYVVWDPTSPDTEGVGGVMRMLMFFTSAWVYRGTQTY